MKFELPDDHNPLTDYESFAFSQLQSIVKKKYSDAPTNMQELIFSVAYANYKKKKKDVCKLLHEEGKSPEEIIKNVHAVSANEQSYDEYIEDSASTIHAVTDATSNYVLSNMTREIIDGVDTKINHTGKSFPTRLWHFLVESVIHGLHIVVAALIIYLAAQALIFIAPTIGVFLDSIGFKYLGDLLQTIQSQGDIDPTK